MSKSDNNQLKSNNNQYHDQTSGQLSSLMGTQSGLQSAADTRASAAFNDAYGGLKDQQITGGFQSDQSAALHQNTDNLMKTGGYDPNSTLSGDMKNATSSGGFDPNKLSGLYSQGQDMASTGGIDPNASAQVMAGYGDMASTGGYTDQAKSNYLNRATSGVTQTYNSLAEQSMRDKARTGGLGTGGGMDAMARHLSQDQASSTLNANDSLNTQINRNKLEGLGGLDTSSRGAAGLKQNALAGMGSLAANEAAGRMQGLGQQSQLESSQASGRRDANSQGIDLSNKEAIGRQMANSGMSHLYDSASGQVSEQGRQMLASMGLNIQNNDQALRILLGLATSQVTGRGITGQIGDSVAIAGQVASGASGGLA